jgi:hypothetical protein
MARAISRLGLPSRLNTNPNTVPEEEFIPGPSIAPAALSSAEVGQPSNPNPPQSLYVRPEQQQVKTPHGYIAVQFAYADQNGIAKLTPEAITHNQIFTLPYSSVNGNTTITGKATYTYGISNGQIVPVQTANSGSVFYQANSSLFSKAQGQYQAGKQGVVATKAELAQYQEALQQPNQSASYYQNYASAISNLMNGEYKGWNTLNYYQNEEQQGRAAMQKYAPVKIANITNNGITPTGSQPTEYLYGNVSGKDQYLGSLSLVPNVSGSNISFTAGKFQGAVVPISGNGWYGGIVTQYQNGSVILNPKNYSSITTNAFGVTSNGATYRYMTPMPTGFGIHTEFGNNVFGGGLIGAKNVVVNTNQGQVIEGFRNGGWYRSGGLDSIITSFISGGKITQNVLVNPSTGGISLSSPSGKPTIAPAPGPTYTYLGTNPSEVTQPPYSFGIAHVPSFGKLSYVGLSSVGPARDLTASNLGVSGRLYLQSAVLNNGSNIGLPSLPIQTGGSNQSLNTTNTSSNQQFFLLNPKFYANLPAGFANTLGNIAHWAYPYQSGGQPTAGGQFPYNYPITKTGINNLPSGVRNAQANQYQQLQNLAAHSYSMTQPNAAYQYLGSPSASGDVLNYLYTPHQFELAVALATPAAGIDAVGLPVVAGSTAIGAGTGAILNPTIEYYIGGVTNPVTLANAAAQGTIYGGYVGAVMPGAESALSNVPGMSATEGTLGKVATLNRGAITGLGVQNLYSYLTTGKPAGPASDIFGIATGAAVPAVLESTGFKVAAAKLSGTDIASKMTISDYVDTYGTKEMPIIQDFSDTIKRFGGNPDNAYLIVNQKTGSIITPYYQDVHLGYAKAADIYSYLREVSANNQGKINLATTSGASLLNDFTVESQNPTYNANLEEPGTDAQTGQALRGVRKYAYGPSEGMYFNVPTLGGRSIQLNYAPEIAPVAGSAVEPKTVFTLNPFGTRATFLTTTTDIGNIDVASLDAFKAETGMNPNTPSGKVAFSKWLAGSATSADKEFYLPYQNYFEGTDEVQVVKTVGSSISALDSQKVLILAGGEGESLRPVFTKLITAQSTGDALSATLDSFSIGPDQSLTDAYREASFQASTPIRYSTLSPPIIAPSLTYSTTSRSVTPTALSGISSIGQPSTSLIGSSITGMDPLISGTFNSLGSLPEISFNYSTTAVSRAHSLAGLPQVTSNIVSNRAASANAAASITSSIFTQRSAHGQSYSRTQRSILLNVYGSELAPPVFDNFPLGVPTHFKNQQHGNHHVFSIRAPRFSYVSDLMHASLGISGPRTMVGISRPVPVKKRGRK